MECGQEIRVKDLYGSNVMRFVAQCHDRFMLISHTYEQLNGYLLADWHGVLRELVAVTVPGKMIEKQKTAESTARGEYHNLPLTYPLSAKGLAGLLDAPEDEVRAQLDDLAVAVD